MESINTSSSQDGKSGSKSVSGNKLLTESEYKKQSEIATQKALKELASELKTNSNHKREKKIKMIQVRSIDSENDSDSDSESDSEKKNNLIIENAQIIQQRKKRKNSDLQTKSFGKFNTNNDESNNDMYQLMLAQREVEMQNNTKLKQKLVEFECEVDKLDNKIHYLQLDLSNKEQELIDIKNKYKKKHDENELNIINFRTANINKNTKLYEVELLNHIYLFILAVSVFYHLKIIFFGC